MFPDLGEGGLFGEDFGCGVEFYVVLARFCFIFYIEKGGWGGGFDRILDW